MLGEDEGGHMIGRLQAYVIDCPDTRALAAFYSELTGMPVTRVDKDGWVVVGPTDGQHLAFQKAPDHVPPQWPDPGHPQQAHLDVLVADLDAAEAQVLALGATALPHRTRGFRVFADPAGHPFCLVRES
jgi:catechol 2,3-dioxygenase-like lactoylglutathione lyase family enzyme